MDDALVVGELHRLGDRADELGGPPRRQRILADECREAVTLDVLHREEVLPLHLADFVDRRRYSDG